MNKTLTGEVWKTVTFPFEIANTGRIEVSNFGRLRTFNKISDGNIIMGSMINGYRIIRLKLYKPREAKTQDGFDYLQKQVFKLARQIKLLKEEGESKEVIDETAELLDILKNKLSKKYKDELKKRTINYHSLIHRLVAEYFLDKPGESQTLVAHLDHEKLNNRSYNLKWMTPEENYEHQKSSPYVIKEKLERRTGRRRNSGLTKLSVTKVMLMKKLLLQGKTVKQMARQFKVTETQIIRIKRGENWGDIEAAK